MKLALVIPGFQADQADWCIPAFTNLAHELAKHVELHVFALRYPHRTANYTIGRVHVHALGGGAFKGRRVILLSLARLWQNLVYSIKREHAASPFSAIMGVWATESGWLATRAAQLLAVPSLVHLAGGELTYIPQIGYGNWQRGLDRLLVPSTLRQADLLTVPSGRMRRALFKAASKARIDSSKIRDWAPGVDTAMFAPQARQARPRAPEEPFTFVTAGSLIPVKGHSLLLKALARLRANNPLLRVRLRIVGDGPLRPMLEKQSNDLRLKGYVNFEGEVRHDALPAIYNTSDAFLLGSWHEAQCMAALEAMACGLPWVGPPVGALADIARTAQGETPSGLTFGSRDPEVVARTMDALVQLGYGERREWGNQARHLVLRDYEMARLAERLLDIMASLAL